MDSLFYGIVKFLFLGFFGLVGFLVLLALLFGKRVIKKWDFEAEFRDAGGREFGELDIEMSRIEKEEPNFSLKARFHMRHPSLKLHQTVQVFIDDLLVLEGMVKTAGRIRLDHRQDLQRQVTDVSEGQICRIVMGGTPMFEEALVRD